MALHGIIHLMGFAKEWDLAPDGIFSGKTLIQLSGNSSRFVGVLWLTACALLLASTFAYYTQKDWFWMIGIAGLVVSQALIILYWQDAKWGTIVNAILLLVVIFAAGKLNFDKMVKREVSYLVSASSGDRFVITEKEVSPFPDVVQRWLRNSHIIGQPMPTSVHIIQKGSMRTAPDSQWMPFDAEQHLTINPPGFVWKATIHANKFIDIAGRDKYENGKGYMLIKAASLIPIANISGEEIDQGTMIRYMAEMIWFPQAAVSGYLHWEEIDSTHALVTMNYGDVSASGIFTFNNSGLPIGFKAERYKEFGGKFSKETWSVAVTGYRYFNGIPVSHSSEVTWMLKEGDFTWLKLNIVEVQIN